MRRRKPLEARRRGLRGFGEKNWGEFRLNFETSRAFGQRILPLESAYSADSTKRG